MIFANLFVAISNTSLVCLKKKKLSECKLKKAFQENQEDLSKPLTYFQWTRVSEQKKIKGVEKTVNFLILLFYT